MEEKILSMYAKGMAAGDIEPHIKGLYDMGIPGSTASRITDKILPTVRGWQDARWKKPMRLYSWMPSITMPAAEGAL